jgi:cob(I)alamin adenosyltransferase
MVRINRIYTRTGDDGTTGLTDGSRVRKHCLRVKSYGEIDELNSFLGRAAVVARQESQLDMATKIETLQNELFDIGAELSTPPPTTLPVNLLVQESQVSRLEQWIDEANDPLPPLTSFVLPGGSLLNAELHICRAVCRRAERSIVELSEQEPMRPVVRNYLNRLSDLLFALTRAASHSAGIAEVLWKPGASR